jgi:hypothetical protein
VYAFCSGARNGLLVVIAKGHCSCWPLLRCYGDGSLLTSESEVVMIFEI